METITSMINHELNINKYLNNNSCFIDIETTGLSRKYNMIYLIGLLYFDPTTNSWILNQYFANDINKESILLKEFTSLLSSFDNIITYNGNSFDLPFINQRLKHHSIDYIIDETKSFDLYQIIKQNRYYLNLKNLKLKTIEESLGFIREDIYSGLDCIGFYYDYLNLGDKSAKINILKHNYDDLAHMLDIMPILDVLEANKSFHIKSKSIIHSFLINNIEIRGDMINISGKIKIPLESDLRYYGTNYNAISKELNKFEFSMEINEGYITPEDKCIFIDTLNLPELDLKDETHYNLPNNIFVLMIKRNYCINNLKALLTQVFQSIVV